MLGKQNPRSALAVLLTNNPSFLSNFMLCYIISSLCFDFVANEKIMLKKKLRKNVTNTKKENVKQVVEWALNKKSKKLTENE